MNFIRQVREQFPRVLFTAGLVLAVLGLAPTANAQTIIYKQNNTNDLTTTGSWVTTFNGTTNIPSAPSAADIGNINSNLTSTSLTFGSTLTIGGFVITNPGIALTMNGSGAVRTLNIGNGTFANGGGIDMSNATTATSLSLGTNVSTVLQGGAQVWTVGNATANPSLTVAGTLNTNGSSLSIAGNGDVTFSGVISGAGTFYQNSSNTTTLSGLNTMSGGVSLYNGTLVLTTAGTGSTASSLGTGNFIISGMYPNGYPVASPQATTINTTGALNFGGASSTNNNLNVDGNFTYNSGFSLQFGNTSSMVDIGHDVTMNVSSATGNLIFNAPVEDGYNGTNNLNSEGFSITKAGSGNLALTTTNWFSGNLNLNVGTLTLTSNLALQNATLNLNGGTLVMTGLTNSTFGGLAATAANASTNIALPTTFTNLTLNTNKYDVDNYAGVISGGCTTSLGAFAININGSGEQIFSGANTFGLNTTVILNSGTLALNTNGTTTSGALGDNATLTIKGGNLDTTVANTVLATVNPENWNGDFTYIGTGNLNLGTGGVTMNATRTVTVSANTLTVGGILTGANGLGLIKDGNGTLVLDGVNTYNGSTTVNAGTLVVGNNNALGNNTATDTNLILSGGNIDANTAGLTLGVHAETWSSSFGFVGSNSLNLGTGAVSMTTTPTITVSANTLTVGGVITGGTNGLTVNGTGNLDLSGNNAFSGVFTINNGAMVSVGVLNNGGTNSSIGNSSAAAANLIINGGTLQYMGAGVTSNRSITVSNLGATLDASGTGALVLNNAGAVTFSNTSAPATINFIGSNTSLNVFDAIIGDAGTGSNTTRVVKNGAGEWELNAANTYTGGTTLSQGTLAIGTNTSLGNGILTITGGSLDNPNAANETLTNNNVEYWNGSFGYKGSTGNLNLGTGQDNLGANITLTVSAKTLTIAGVISDGSAGTTGYGGSAGYSITTAGAGNLALNATNTFTGNLNLAAATLQLNNLTALENATLNFTGGTLTLATGTNQFGGLAGSSAIALGTNNITLNSATGVSDAYTGALSGSGNLVMNGSSTTEEYTYNIGGGNVTTGPATFTGNGTETLSGVSTFTGCTTVNAGTLILSGNNTGVQGVTTLAGGTLVLNTNGTASAGVFGNNGTLTITGGNLNTTNTNTNITTVDPENWNGNFTFLGSGNLNLGTGAVTMNATRTVTVSANTLTVGGIIGGSGDGLTKNGTGTLVLTGINTYNGTTTVNAGTLGLVFLANNTANIINGTASTGSALVLAGGQVSITGCTSGNSSTDSQTFTSTTVNAGNSSIVGTMTSTNATGLTIGLGTVTRNAGGTLALTKPANGSINATVIKTNNVVTGSNGIAYMTFNGTDWANTSANNSLGTITAITAAQYSNNTANMSAVTAATNERISSNITMNGSSTLGTLLYNGTANNTLTATGFNLTINTGGILLSSNATGNFTIAGGNIMGQASASDELVVIQNMAGNFTISSNIINDGTNGTILTKSGTGELILGGTNTYSGNTYLNSGTLVFGSTTAIGATAANLVITGGTLDANSSITNANNNAQFWNGSFAFAGSNSLNLGTGNVAMNGPITVTVNGANTLTVGGNISGTNGLTLAGAGTGTLMLTNGSSTYTGGTIINDGILEASGNNALGAAGSAVTVASGATLRLDNNFDTTGTGTTTGTSAGAMLTLSGAGVGGNGALINGNGTAQWDGNINLVGNATIGSGSTSGGCLSIGGGNFTGGTFSSFLNLGDNTLTFVGGNNTTTMVNAFIAGSGNVVVNEGNGTSANLGTVYDYMNGNGYTGSTTIDSGTLVLDTTGNSTQHAGGTVNGVINLLAINGPIVIGNATNIVANTAILQMGNGTDTARYTISDNAPVTINPSGFFNVDGQYAMIGNLTMNGGLINTTAGSSTYGVLQVQGNVTVQAQGTTYTAATIDGNMEMQNVAANPLTYYNITHGTNTGSDLTINALLSGGSFIQTGNGTMTLTSNLNSFNGTAEIQGGTLSITASNALGLNSTNATEGTTVDAGAQLQIQNGITVPEYLTINGQGTTGANGTTVSDGALQNLAGSNTYSGIINVPTNATINTTAGSLYISGNVVGSNSATLSFNATTNTVATTVSGVISGPMSVVLNNGSLTFNGTASNTYTGNTTINSGTLTLNATSSTNAISGTTITINNGGTLLSQSTENIGNSVNMVLNGGTWQTQGTGSFVENLGTLTLTATSNLTLGSGNNQVQFQNSSSATWAGDSTLYINDWNGLTAGLGTDQVDFTQLSGLNGTSWTGQLGDIIFVNPTINGVAETGDFHAIILTTNGEVVPFFPAPEPGTLAAGAALGALALVRELRRRKKNA